MAINGSITPHSCPTCREFYVAGMWYHNILAFRYSYTWDLEPLDLTTVPHHLRSHLLPGIRAVYLNQDEPRGAASSLETTTIEIARVRAENEVLRHNCGMWRRRAEAHSSATLGLIGLARLARTQAFYMKHERDQLQQRCEALKRKIDNDV